MLDPNLEKIRDCHLEEIKEGKLGNTIQEAEDYLQYMLRFNEKQINKELSSFARHIRHLHKEMKNAQAQG